MTEECDVPLLNLDIIAYRTLAQIIGDIPCPSRDKMQEYNTKTLLEAMHDPFFRYECDEVRRGIILSLTSYVQPFGPSKFKSHSFIYCPLEL